MTPEAQRIAIAEACGWTEIRQSTRWEVTDPPDDPIVLCGRINDVGGHVPDYLNDLNAMHEAEKQLTAGQARTYDKELQKIGYRERMAGAFWLWHFPPQWKAEAFLRTIGKWVD